MSPRRTTNDGHTLSDSLDLRRSCPDRDIGLLVRRIGEIQRVDFTLTGAQVVRAALRSFLCKLGALDTADQIAAVREALNAAPGGIT